MPNRRRLFHEVPGWVDDLLQTWFVTICCQHRGTNQLATPDIGQQLLESVAYRHTHQLWYAHLFLLMPDHCHALLSFGRENDGLRTISDWKRRVAREFGVLWQPDFFEHRLRGEDSFDEKAEYIRQNPVRAGLISEGEAWPYVKQARDFEVK
jgi:REP element-mobilizing transposase RayT